VEATTGTQALEIALSHDLTLVLTDSVMPQMSGRALANRLHERHPGVPVLYMSGYTAGALGPQPDCNDGARLLQKPFTERSLLDSVAATIADASAAGEGGSALRGSGSSPSISPSSLSA
jgi:two-component system cell cycle sensor histidine kinase/response regulator CckA